MEPENQPISSGAFLRRKREEAGLTISELALELQITPIFIKYLENEEYHNFSAKLYAKSFLVKVLEGLRVEEKQDIIDLFESSWQKNIGWEKGLGQVNKKSILILTPGRLSFLGGVMLFLFWIFFFGWRLTKIIIPPELDLIEPKDKILLTDSKLKIRGSAQKESRLSMNGLEINTDSKGYFDTYIALAPGLNTLEFYAQSRFGKTKKVVRYVVLK